MDAVRHGPSHTTVAHFSKLGRPASIAGHGAKGVRIGATQVRLHFLEGQIKIVHVLHHIQHRRITLLSCLRRVAKAAWRTARPKAPIVQEGLELLEARPSIETLVSLRVKPDAVSPRPLNCSVARLHFSRRVALPLEPLTL